MLDILNNSCNNVSGSVIRFVYSTSISLSVLNKNLIKLIYFILSFSSYDDISLHSVFINYSL